MSDTCPDCTHAKSVHSFVGCMAVTDELCPCEREFPEYAKATSPQWAEAEKVEAIAKAERGADPAWVDAAEDAACTLARLTTATGGFTADNVWALLEERQVPAPREPRALGPVLQRLKRQDKLKLTGYAPSNRRHKSPVGVYAAGPEL